MDEIIKGEVTAMAFGGQGIIRHEGLVVFVPFTAVGDRVVCRITQRKKTYATAQLEEILNPSPERTTPLCPYFGRCGGCQLQHIHYEAQLEHKRKWIEDALTRIGHFSEIQVPPVIAAERCWAYRRHVTLTLRSASKGFAAGYIMVDNKSVLPVLSCPIFIEAEERLLEHIQDVVSQISSSPENQGRLSIYKAENGGFLLHFHFDSCPVNCKEVLTAWKKSRKEITGIIVTTPRDRQEYGQCLSNMDVEGLTIKFTPHVFIQNHPEQSLNIYREVCSLVGTAGSKTVLDLYCGIGITTLLLAKKGIHMTGVESNPEAIKLAKENAAINGLEGIRFECADVKKVLRQMLEKHKPDLAILNPPRTGLDPKVVSTLVEKGPRDLVYISCMPSTLARDLKVLCNNRYKIVSCQGFDMFPQTAHVETIVHMKDKNGTTLSF